jgi:hypothetical protein
MRGNAIRWSVGPSADLCTGGRTGPGVGDRRRARGFSDGGDCDGGLYLDEEETTHPDQIPLLALRQFDDDGVLYGEVWFQPADLTTLIAALTEQLHLNYLPGTRRWRGSAGRADVEYGVVVQPALSCAGAAWGAPCSVRLARAAAPSELIARQLGHCDQQGWDSNSRPAL